MRVGIPRALLIYKYFPIWKTFLENLGVEVIISPNTNKTILDEGTKTSVDDACLPVKIYHGHVKHLMNKVDKVFVPRLMSVARHEFICPKFCGLPEMIKNDIKMPINLAILDINLHQDPKSIFQNYYEFGVTFTKNKRKIQNAFRDAIEMQKSYNKDLLKGRLPFANPNDIWNYNSTVKSKLTIGLLAHPYILYDNFINMNILSKLNNEKVSIIVPEMIPDEVIEEESNSFPKKMFWTLGKNLYGSAKYMLRNNRVNGIIFLSSFGCGIDSIMSDFIERSVREKKIPFTIITLDEHTGEAGLNTRLEAFLDMILWRSQNENNISSYGERLYSHQVPF